MSLLIRRVNCSKKSNKMYLDIFECYDHSRWVDVEEYLTSKYGSIERCIRSYQLNIRELYGGTPRE